MLNKSSTTMQKLSALLTVCLLVLTGAGCRDVSNKCSITMRKLSALLTVCLRLQEAWTCQKAEWHDHERVFCPAHNVLALAGDGSRNVVLPCFRAAADRSSDRGADHNGLTSGL